MPIVSAIFYRRHLREFPPSSPPPLSRSVGNDAGSSLRRLRGVLRPVSGFGKRILWNVVAQHDATLGVHDMEAQYLALEAVVPDALGRW